MTLLSLIEHSFPKGPKIAAYFLLTENFSNKPFILCETSSRERLPEEKGYYPGKDAWIRQESEALKNDFSKIKLAIWFSQDEFEINSSIEAQSSFLKYFWMDPYFISGYKNFIPEK